MSGFKDTFTKDDDNKGLGYDDIAFYYFASSIVFVIVVPLTYSVITNFLFGTNSQEFPRYSSTGKEFRYCKTETMQRKLDEARIEAKKHTTSGTVKFAFKMLILIAVWVGLFYLTSQCANTKEIKNFDPFEILEVDADADNSVIKKAYRKMSLIYHPDKNQGDPVAQAKFIQITKAYEALTDETARDNYEKYGNPDGPDASSKVGIGLPQFLLEKDNHVLILCSFFFVLLIFVPTVGICYYNRIKEFMPSGVMVETFQMLSDPRYAADQRCKTLRDSTRLKDLPELIAITKEGMNIPYFGTPEYQKALTMITKEADIKPTKWHPVAERNKTLIQAHMCRLHHMMTPEMKDELNILLKSSMKITLEMMNIIQERTQLSLIHPEYAKHFGLGIEWLEAARCVIQFRRSLVQAVSPLKDSEKDCELLQIPHFTYEVLSHCQKGKQSKKINGLSDWISRDPEDRKGLRDMGTNQILDMDEFCHHISKVTLDAKIDVEGEEDEVICMGDTASINVKLTRTNLEANQAMGPAHAPYFPEPKFEEWWLFVTEYNSKKILASEKIRDQGHIAEAKIQLPVDKPFINGAGKKKIEVHALCDGYCGIDQKLVLDFTVVIPDDLKREVYVHPDDEALDDHPTLFQQMMGLQNDDHSDEEDEDEDKKKPESKKSKNQKKKDDDSASNSSDDEKEDKKEEAADEEKDKSEEKENSDESKKASTKKNKEKTKKDDSDSDSDSDSGSDDDKTPPKKSNGPCSACVIS